MTGRLSFLWSLSASDSAEEKGAFFVDSRRNTSFIMGEHQNSGIVRIYK